MDLSKKILFIGLGKYRFFLLKGLSKINNNLLYVFRPDALYIKKIEKLNLKNVVIITDEIYLKKLKDVAYVVIGRKKDTKYLKLIKLREAIILSYFDFEKNESKYHHICYLMHNMAVEIGKGILSIYVHSKKNKGVEDKIKDLLSPLGEVLIVNSKHELFEKYRVIVGSTIGYLSYLINELKEAYLLSYNEDNNRIEDLIRRSILGINFYLSKKRKIEDIFNNSIIKQGKIDIFSRYFFNIKEHFMASFMSGDGGKEIENKIQNNSLYEQFNEILLMIESKIDNFVAKSDERQDIKFVEYCENLFKKEAIWEKIIDWFQNEGIKVIWCNPYSTDPRDIYFIPDDQSGKKIISWYKEKEWEKHITSLTSIIQKIEIKKSFGKPWIIYFKDSQKAIEKTPKCLKDMFYMTNFEFLRNYIKRKKLIVKDIRHFNNVSIRENILKNIRKELKKLHNSLIKDEDLKKIINYHIWVESAYKKDRKCRDEWNLMILFPVGILSEKIIPYGVNIGLNVNLNGRKELVEELFKKIRLLRVLFFFSFSYLIEAYLIKQKEIATKHALKSAIAAIMSRNMSHNIGSHVISRLVGHRVDSGFNNKELNLINTIDNNKLQNSLINSSNEHKSLLKSFAKGTKKLLDWAKDVQYMLKYLQQRQDFLAMVSTEWPEWTDVAYFMQDIMRWFFYQKLILDNIAASEGLSIHSYKNNTYKDIRFHVYLVNENLWNEKANILEDRFNQLKNGSTKRTQIILHTKKGESIGRLSDDIQVAIPGGVIGYHSFYILLENIIRNSARHSFENSKEKHLDVVIEILYDPRGEIGISLNGEKKPAYLFRIYNNVGKINNRHNGIILWKGQKKGELKKGINDYLGMALINESGTLRKECWGMAEMKIAAGFLQSRDIDQIGAGGEKIYGPYQRGDFLKFAKSTEGSPYIIRAVESPISTLGFEFYVKKPKIAGIVCKNGKQ